MRLRKASVDEPGWSRRKQGRGFTYLDNGRRLSAEERARCEALVIPPAWTDVWICPAENGHIQAVGKDEAGRRQYLYHPKWREKQDAAKFEAMLDFAARLPGARATVTRHLRGSDNLEFACAFAFRMLDVGAFRIGTHRYTDEHGSHGLLTLERRHVTAAGRAVHFSFSSKSHQHHELTSDDPDIVRGVGKFLDRAKKPTSHLMQWHNGEGWCDLSPELLTEYVKARTGPETTVKDFRTWQANVVAATTLALLPAETKTERNRAVREAYAAAADHLGNTPAVAKSGYVDPRLIELSEHGEAIDASLARRHKIRAGRIMPSRIESALRELLS